MNKLKKLAAFVTGILMFALAALFSVSLIQGILDFGVPKDGTISYLYETGKILFEIYGFTSILIPVFFMVAGFFCFDAKWSLQRAFCLLVSIIPFFTLFLAEQLTRAAIKTEVNPVLSVKVCTYYVIAVLLVAAEFLAAGVIGGLIQQRTASSSKKKKAEAARAAAVASVAEAEGEIQSAGNASDESMEAPAKKEKLTWAERKAQWDEKRREKARAREQAKKDREIWVDESRSDESSPAAQEDFSAFDAAVQEENASAAKAVEDDGGAIQVLGGGSVTADDAFESPAAPAKKAGKYDDVWSLDDEGNLKVSDSAKDKLEKAEKELDRQIYRADPQQGFIPNDDEDYAPVSSYEDEVAYEKDEPDFVSNDDEYSDDLDDVIGDFERSNLQVQEEAEREETKTFLPPEFDDADDEIEENAIDYSDIGREDLVGDVVPSKDMFATVSGSAILTEPEPDPDEPVEAEPVQDAPKEEKRSSSAFSGLDNVFARMDMDARSVAGGENLEEEHFISSRTTVQSEDSTISSVKSGEFEDKSGNNVSEGVAKVNAAPVQEKPAEPIKVPVATYTDFNGNVVPVKSTPKRRRGPYSISTDLLTEYEENPYWEIDEETNQAAQNLKETLSEFNIDAEVIAIRKGPVVTMFEILPASGVKLSKIQALQDNIALRLAATSVRIVAPIPGKRAVGIEIPNKSRAIVSFRECIEQDRPEWKKCQVPVILGKDIEGETQVMDLVKTPHLLIAGSTGAGKSVCVNSMILSILFKRSPNDVKMILIDPKIVELSLYNGIGHLLTPVITEPKMAMQALQYCLCEMERRYAVLKGMSCRDIISYNTKIREQHIATEKLPYIIVVIDEFADLMATTGKQLEQSVARLAAKARAVGIHLVLATQRPSVDVITGLIKANIPSRIAFMVSSKMDSRIIIDQMGADKLLGKGDMLYASATDPFPVRIQGAFVSDQEVENVVGAVKECWGEPEYIDDEIFVDDEDEDGGDQMSLFTEPGEDPLYEKALDIVVQTGKGSASFLQRKLSIGYNRAARLVELMEERGILGPANGSKPREIIRMP